jgi:hypothetical protein
MGKKKIYNKLYDIFNNYSIYLNKFFTKLKKKKINKKINRKINKKLLSNFKIGLIIYNNNKKKINLNNYFMEKKIYFNNIYSLY